MERRFLFPISLKKIIFVDTDQIVKSDLTELRDLDLGGAPYGYTVGDNIIKKYC